MKVEFQKTGSDDCPLIRIFGDEPEVCRHLLKAFEQLAQGVISELSLSDLPGIEPVDGCLLIATAGKWDRGVLQDEGNRFRWILTPETWDDVAGLTEPFSFPRDVCYQWLNQAGQIRVLLSHDGCW